MITAAITRCRAPVAQCVAAEQSDLMQLTHKQLTRIAKHDLGAAALAEYILAHPAFSGCGDGPTALPAQGEVAELVAALEADAECVAAEQSDLMQLTHKQLTRIAAILKGIPALPAPGFQIGPQEYIPHA